MQPRKYRSARDDPTTRPLGRGGDSLDLREDFEGNSNGDRVAEFRFCHGGFYL